MKSLLKTGLIAIFSIGAAAFAPLFDPYATGLPLRQPARTIHHARSGSLKTIRCSALEEKQFCDRRTVMGLFVSSLALISYSAPAYAKPTKATAEDTVTAWKKLAAANDLLATTDAIASKKDWDALVALLDRPEFQEMESVLLILVNGPVLNQDDKKTIGTRKRYGIAADVLYGIGGVKAAVASISDPQIQGCSAGVCSGKFVQADEEVPKSLKSLKASVIEILNICKAYKEFS